MKTLYFFLLALIFAGLMACNSSVKSETKGCDSHEHSQKHECDHEHPAQESFAVEASDTVHEHECNGDHDHDHDHSHDHGKGKHTHKH